MSALPACLRESSGAVLLSVKVTPRTSRNEIGGLHGDALKIKVTAPPVDSAANEAVLELLAETLNCHRKTLQLVRGGTSRQKVISITGITAQTLVKKLGLRKLGPLEKQPDSTRFPKWISHEETERTEREQVVSELRW